MLFLSLITLIVAIPLYTYRISPYTYIRIGSIILIYSAILAFNCFNIESIQSGISIYSGLFQVTRISQRIEIFIYIIGRIILFGWRVESYREVNFNIVNNVGYSQYYSENTSFKNNSINYFNNIFGQYLAVNQGRNNDIEMKKNSISASANNNFFSYVPTHNEFSLLIIFTSLGASFLLSSSDLISIYLSIELQSFAVYILSTLYRNSESATAAGLKYFLLGGLSSAIILLGIGIVYSYRGITQIERIFNIMTSSIRSKEIADIVINSSVYRQGLYDSSSILFGIILICIGFLFKVAAAPFHSWAPDVYDGVPTIITSWIRIMPKISIFILLLEIHRGINSISSISSTMTRSSISSLWPKDEINYPLWISIRSFWKEQEIFKNLLLICSVFSLIIGTIVGLSQYRIKRLLAFSRISHVGFILMALAIFTEESIESFLFYIIQYSITNRNIFLILLRFGYLIRFNSDHKSILPITRNQSSFSTNYVVNSQKINDEIKSNIIFDSKNNKYNNTNINIQSDISPEVNNDIIFISQLKGQFYSNPLLSLRFAISLFSMAGIPPLVGFFAKQMVLYSSIHNRYYFISFVAIIVSVISASYYLKIIQVMYFNSDKPKSQSKYIKVQENIHYSLKNNSNNIENSLISPVSNIHSIFISIITLFTTLFIIHPTVILNRCEIIRLSIFSALIFYYFSTLVKTTALETILTIIFVLLSYIIEKWAKD